MNRRFTATTVSLTAAVAFSLGLVVAAPLTPTPIASASAVQAPQTGAARRTAPPPVGIVSVADVAGCVSRGYIGVRPRDLDRDLERSLRLGQVEGAPCPGDPLTFYLCVPSAGRREPRPIQVEGQ